MDGNFGKRFSFGLAGRIQGSAAVPAAVRRASRSPGEDKTPPGQPAKPALSAVEGMPALRLTVHGVILNGLQAMKDLACGGYEVWDSSCGGTREILRD